MNANSSVFAVIGILRTRILLASITAEAFVAITVDKIPINASISEAFASIQAVIAAHVDFTTLSHETLRTNADVSIIALSPIQTNDFFTILCNTILTTQSRVSVRAFTEGLGMSRDEALSVVDAEVVTGVSFFGEVVITIPSMPTIVTFTVG